MFSSYKHIQELENSIFSILNENSIFKSVKVKETILANVRSTFDTFYDTRTKEKNIKDSRCVITVTGENLNDDNIKEKVQFLIKNGVTPTRNADRGEEHEGEENSQETIPPPPPTPPNHNPEEGVQRTESFEVKTKQGPKKVFKVTLNRDSGLCNKKNKKVSLAFVAQTGAYALNKTAKDAEKIYVERDIPRIYKTKKKSYDTIARDIRKIEGKDFKTKVAFDYFNKTLNLKVKQDKKWINLEKVDCPTLADLKDRFLGIKDIEPTLKSK